MNYLLTAFFSLLVGIGTGGLIEHHLNRDRLRTEAVERGHAEWLVNQKDGTTKWQWKELKSVP